MKKLTIVLCFMMAIAAVISWGSGAGAYSSYFSADCAACHTNDAVSCASCHAHGVHSSSSKSDINVKATTDKAVYAPGETVTVSITGGYRPGWVRAVVYDEAGREVARSSGPCNDPTAPDSGCGSGDQFPGPIVLSALAPMTPGRHTFAASWYGNRFDRSGAFFGQNWRPDPNNPDHGEELVQTNFFDVVAPTTCTDGDNDGFAVEGGACGPVDCNDNDSGINPGAAENCADGVDNNCNGLVDAADPGAVNCPLPCTDGDNDGFAVEGGACGPVDCNDGNPQVHPGAVEDCADGVDNNCDGNVDGADSSCRPSTADYDIVKLRCVRKAEFTVGEQKGKEIKVEVAIQNQGSTDPGAVLKLWGTRGDSVIVLTPENGLTVSDEPGGGRKTLKFFHAPARAGDIRWHAKLDDGDPDTDEAFCTTRVILKKHGADD